MSSETEAAAPSELIASELIASELIVCVKCLGAEDGAPEGGKRPGEALYEALEAAGFPEGITLRAENCLQNCDRGCSVAMRGGAGRWTYVYGHLTAEDDMVEMLHGGMVAYHETKDGVIPWRQRPEHFKRNCIARIPPETVDEAPNLTGD